MRRPFDDSDDEDFSSRLPKRRALESFTTPSAPTPAPPPAATAGDDDDDIDPLDAFMAGITHQVKTQAAAPKPSHRRDDLEEEDAVESYINHMKSKGVEVGTNAVDAREYADSDEEVYATAKAMEGKPQFDDGDGGKKEIDPLPLVDHSSITYNEFEKNLYEEHSEIAKLSEEEVAKIRRDLDIRVTGYNVPKPCLSFAHFGFAQPLMSAITRQGFTEPSGIQRQAIPVAMMHIMDQAELERGDGPIGLILAPTRELAQQIYVETKKYAKGFGLKTAVGNGVEILVATPGRLIDLIKMKATNLRRVTFLVLDEADRMFDLGFEPQIRSICHNVRPERQTLLFSATFQKRVETLAREVLEEPVRITIGGVGVSNKDVRQGYKCLALHGDMMQHERERVIHEFKSGKCRMMVSTDVAGRGLDIKTIRNVVNYDVARDIDSHVHRCGRTGRAGEKGTAYTLVTKKEDWFAAELVRNLEDSGEVLGRRRERGWKRGWEGTWERVWGGFGGGGGGGGGGRGGFGGEPEILNRFGIV
ncbi:P-loop containing nucleoside triphosphate hydrolase protein [Chytridium lagenaria]|nr:P-loop containing nucleoside triphosphate hydrolase protein [Chytridium lagenaria]